jgi:spermidine synthase
MKPLSKKRSILLAYTASFGRRAELNSAVSPICNRQSGGRFRRVRPGPHHAGCNPALRQSATLRYELNMNPTLFRRVALFWAVLFCVVRLQASVVFDNFSAYHHIQVVDDRGTRTLSFNGSRETCMSLTNSLRGHFEYTEYFQMPWLWNPDPKRVLMAGLGGGSTQRAFQHYYTNVMVDTVEIDPVVVAVAKKYFGVTETLKHAIHTNDARVFLRRTTNIYDAIIMDAYATTRYGSSVPPHLTTKEFFIIARDHLTTNGVVAYNIIGQINGWRSDFVGSLYRTLKEVFPQVYFFPANESQNVVLIATKSAELYNAARVQREGVALVRSGTVKLPTFPTRLRSFINTAPETATRSPVLTDDRAPVEGLIK